MRVLLRLWRPVRLVLAGVVRRGWLIARLFWWLVGHGLHSGVETILLSVDNKEVTLVGLSTRHRYTMQVYSHTREYVAIA